MGLLDTLAKAFDLWLPVEQREQSGNDVPHSPQGCKVPGDLPNQSRPSSGGMEC